VRLFFQFSSVFIFIFLCLFFYILPFLS
jgi:hypothetical protein